MFNLWITPLNQQPSEEPGCSLCCRLCTAAMPQETHTCDSAAAPWATALCTHPPLVGPPPRGKVSWMPAQLIQACQETAGLVGRQVCDLPWWVHTVYLTPSCAVKPWYSVIFSSSGALWLLLRGHSQLTLNTSADISDSSTLFGPSMVTEMWIWAENTATLWTVCLKLLGWPSRLWLLPRSDESGATPGWLEYLAFSTWLSHQWWLSPPSIESLRCLTVFFFSGTEGIIVAQQKKLERQGRRRQDKLTDWIMKLTQWDLTNQGQEQEMLRSVACSVPVHALCCLFQQSYSCVTLAPQPAFSPASRINSTLHILILGQDPLGVTWCQRVLIELLCVTNYINNSMMHSKVMQTRSHKYELSFSSTNEGGRQQNWVFLSQNLTLLSSLMSVFCT